MNPYQYQTLPPLTLIPTPTYPIIKDYDLYINSILSGVGPQGPQGEQGPAGPAGPPGSLLVPVNIVSDSYVATVNDYFIGVMPNSSITITLPLATAGTTYIIKDIQGTASVNPITVNTTSIIDGFVDASISTDYGALTFLATGNSWSIV